MPILETDKNRREISPSSRKKGAIFKKKGGIFYSLLYTELYTFFFSKKKRSILHVN